VSAVTLNPKCYDTCHMGLFVKLAHYKVEELVYSIKFGSITLPENHVVETKKLPSFQNSFPVLI